MAYRSIVGASPWGGYSHQGAGREFTMDEAKAAVGTLVTSLQRNGGITVAEVVKAGSMGHGTAVPGHFDIDLVLYSRDISAEEVKNFGCDRWLRHLQAFLQSTPGLDVKIERLTPHAVQFTYKGKIDVDLLVSPYWGNDPNSFYKFLRTVPRGQQFDFSVNASKWQVKFFQDQPNQVKEFIRRAKAWRNKKWSKSAGGSGRPKSYMLSLLVLQAYEKATRVVRKENTQQVAKQTTAELQQMVDNHRSLDIIYWDVNYSKHDYSNWIPSCPRIIDPANPFNNLYETGIGRYRPNERACDYEPGDGNWTPFREKVGTLDLTKTVEEIQSTRY